LPLLPLPLPPEPADACMCKAPVAKAAPKTKLAAFTALRRARLIFGVLLIPGSKLTASNYILGVGNFELCNYFKPWGKGGALEVPQSSYDS
jgi:hypothetical protein